ncbi:GGDEF domain-containing protein [Acidisoma cladoniae]|jgi:diguanylate cyclase (GGDEF)-like protein|uniref:GGDEF domain-containing protein n=1 Tax=Acidisoma cladoniae TaxID=3040935 RepID=UPI00254BA363|nr:diguanylate cyclase [Acidisoma sp. PAMC 29798]
MSDPRPAAPPIVRRLTLGYLAALTIVALLTVVSHLTLQHALHTENGSAAVVNVSGRQRMLSQRIASLAAQYALGDAGARASLELALTQFDTAHARLVHGDPAEDLPPAASSPGLQALYFGGPDPLDAQVRRYSAAATMVLTLSPADPRMKPLLTALFAQARAPLLVGLEAVVMAHQRASETQLRTLRRIQDTTLIVILLTLMVEALAIFRPLVHRISRYALQLMTLATIDPLTGALNRRSFFERGASILEQAKRHQQPLSLLMIDADRFKLINDQHGHATGDTVLQALAKALREGTRGSDLVGRLGGEEFAVLLADADAVSARQTAERLRAAVAALRLGRDGAAIHFTISIGLASVAPADTGLDIPLARADAALYIAKESGRDRVECAT